MGIIRQHNWGAILWVILLGVYCSLGQLSHKKPWPTYSLQNMPQTRFTCHDKILGGYYADPETQCQMFHVCVKVAGVGVQDFRFLCPNSTAFDQEAQICANWGDVDCEQAVLYYGSDNFDLYRIGSGFESKRAPLAEEEEATFHLQRAETGDLRRSKETRVDQKIRPETSSYTNKYQSTTRGPFSNGNGNSESRKSNYDQNNDFNKVTQRFDGPKKSTSSYFTTPKVNDFYNNADSKQDADDLFKGSHSSNFFSNRNGGREDDFYDSKQTASTSTTTSRPSNPFYNGNLQQGEYNKIADVTTKRPHRSRRPILNNPNSLVPSTTTTRPSTPSSTYATTVTDIPKTTRRFSAQTSFNYGNDQYYKQSSSSSTSSSSTSTTSTTQRSSSAAQRFSFTAADYQQNIKPTTYSPSSAFRYKTTTSKYDDIDETALRGEKPDQRAFLNSQYENQNFEVFSRVSNRKSDNAERNIYKQQAKDTALANRNEFTDFAKNKEPSGFQVPSRAPQVHSNAPQVPLNFNVQPLDPSKLNSELNNINQTQQPGRGRVPFNRVNDRQQVEPQYFRTRPQETPAPFAVPHAQKRYDNNLNGSTQKDSSRTKGDLKNNAEPQSQPQQQQISKALESNFNTYSNTQSRTRQDQRTGVVSNNGYLPLSQNQPVPSPTDSTLSGLNPPQRDFGRTRTKQRLGGNKINSQQQQAPKQFETNFNGSNGSKSFNSAQKEASRTRLEQQSFQQKTSHQSNFIGFNSQQGDIIRSKTKSRTGSTTSTSEPSFSTTTGAYIPESTPIRGRGRINYKATTQHQGRSLDNFVSSTTSGTKKFSTLVPKDQYYPTTFKPSNYKKAFDQKPTKYIEPKSTYVSSTTSSPSTPDEDDGQYHPELYENDYSSNNVVPSKKPSTQTTSYSEPTFFSTSPQHRVTPNFQPTNSPQTHLQSQQQTAFQKQPQHPQNNFQQQSQQKHSIATPTDLSDEEELFKTAHSLNLGAASINKLRADTIKTADKTQQQSSLNFGFDRSIQTSTTFATAPLTLTSTTTTWRPTITSTTTSRKTVLPSEKPKKSSSSKRPPHADADTSYDYAYYDSLSETPQEYPEYDVIAEFTKTKKH